MTRARMIPREFDSGPMEGEVVWMPVDMKRLRVARELNGLRLLDTYVVTPCGRMTFYETEPEPRGGGDTDG